jgi:hypothetical protein
MSLILGEWREGKVRPLPGNTPRDRPVSRGVFLLAMEHLRRSLPHHSIPAAIDTGRPVCVF